MESHALLFISFRGTRWSCVLVRMIAATALLAAAAKPGRAQDPFEIHVLEYENLPLGEYEFETHMNTTRSPYAFHMAYEFTAGLTNYFSLGVMQLNTDLANTSLEYSGWRLVPHLYAPQSWHLPFALGLTTELSFEKDGSPGTSTGLEFIPMIEKRFGEHWKVDANPSVGKILNGVGPKHWTAGFAGRIAYERRSRFTPALEYYNDLGELLAFEALTRQSHQIYPGGDIRVTDRLLLNAGVGFGLTAGSVPLTLKMRIEFDFGHRSGP